MDSAAPLLKVAGIALSLALNFALFLASFRLLTSAKLTFRELAPGAVFAAIAGRSCRSSAAIYIAHVASGPSNTYGTFALVLGVLAWLHLGS